ncbi:hypothetical protein NIES4071_06470 [Calothrix sp. NIES-4071]|nr:hypothetical protein NIES4071_06470 [Calothrix sp. NIES-4071]BAZ54989.1 hypothetical protein NIES4105_06430 [Calothrix sp. NIES-4105]
MIIKDIKFAELEKLLLSIGFVEKNEIFITNRSRREGHKGRKRRYMFKILRMI